MDLNRIAELEATCELLRTENQDLHRELRRANEDTIPSPPENMHEMTDRDLLEHAIRGQYAIAGRVNVLALEVSRLSRETSEHGRTLRDVVPELRVASATIRDHGQRIGRLLEEHSRNHAGISLVPPVDDAVDSQR